MMPVFEGLAAQGLTNLSIMRARDAWQVNVQFTGMKGHFVYVGATIDNALAQALGMQVEGSDLI